MNICIQKLTLVNTLYTFKSGSFAVFMQYLRRPFDTFKYFFFSRHFLFLERLSFWTSGRWILRLWTLSSHAWKKGSGTPDFKLTAAIFFSRAESIIDDTLCVIWKGCVIQCQQERGFSVQRAPTRSSGITLLLWLHQPENSTTARGVAKIYAWARAHSAIQMHKHGMGQFRARRWTAVHLAKCWWPFLHNPSN